MTMTDPIADLLTRIRNAQNVTHKRVEVPASKLKNELVSILKREGYIEDFEYIDDDKQGILRVELKYGDNNEKVITGLKRISKPGLRVYAQKEEIPKVLGGLGVAVVSTSKGLLTDREARDHGVGGEVLCYIW
ncbi:30S ribosomal protein S8 [Natranaerobius trueperi]|uniref:Small ribosomal subunit protein uS8 n=1 Tax=Natranaerobius trueperi TaxID=759412 RepID=A0A226BZR3_9FIRM|nr:30S ribosomal protein S8 [Natranaerobius trueperi]OWZ84476.1 30S ribosomal protein S8 [Natranaerobius trueperi]